MLATTALLLAAAKRKKNLPPLLPEWFSLPYKISAALLALFLLFTPLITRHTSASALLSFCYGAIVTPLFEEMIFSWTAVGADKRPVQKRKGGLSDFKRTVCHMALRLRGHHPLAHLTFLARCRYCAHSADEGAHCVSHRAGVGPGAPKMQKRLRCADAPYADQCDRFLINRSSSA